MRQDQSSEATPIVATGSPGARRSAWLTAVAAAALVFTACTGGGSASPSGVGASPSGASPSAASPSGGASPSGASPSASGPTTSYPEAPITFVVPFSAGGPTDTVTRLIAEPMKAALGQDIVVTNVTGAGGTLAAGQVAEAAGDGYTVLMHHIGMSTAPALYPDLPYDPLTDFKTIGLVTEVPMTFIGRKGYAPNTMQELVADVKARGQEVRYGHAGPGAASHLCGLLFQDAVEARVTEVPYPGTADVMDDLLGDRDLDISCDQTTNTTEQIGEGGVKAYAITSPERNEALPDVPTTAEAGLPDIAVGVWHGLYVPSETPDEVIAVLTNALKAALQDENVITSFARLGTTPVADDQVTPQAHTQKLQEQIDLWGPIIEQAGTGPTP